MSWFSINNLTITSQCFSSHVTDIFTLFKLALLFNLLPRHIESQYSQQVSNHLNLRQMDRIRSIKYLIHYTRVNSSLTLIFHRVFLPGFNVFTAIKTCSFGESGLFCSV